MRRQPLRESPKSPDDLCAQALREQCAKNMATWLKGSLNIQRSIASMNAAEMQGLAQECISTFILATHARLMAEQKPYPRLHRRLRKLLGLPDGSEPPFPYPREKWWLAG